jgi:hypothetical protein
MYPPEHIVRDIARVHKWARIGWVGLPKTDPAEINVGKYYLVQLYHWRDAEQSVRERWNERGPLFGARFNPLMRIPIMIGEVSIADVFSGKVVHTLKWWMKPIDQRIRESQQKASLEYASKVGDVAEAQTDWLLWKSNQTDATRPTPVAKKFMTEEDKKILDGEYNKDLKDALVTQ